MRPLSAKRIQRLLLRQHFRDVWHWNRECNGLIRDFCVYVRDPTSPRIDCTIWTDAIRPIWSEEERKDCLWDDDLKFAFDTYPTPLWGWLAMAKWVCGWSAVEELSIAVNGANSKLIDVNGVKENIKNLFSVLMSCGCNGGAALNVYHNGDSKTGCTPLTVAASDCKLAFDLLIAQPEIDAFVQFGSTSPLQLAILWPNEAGAQEILMRFTESQRQTTIRNPVVLLLAVDFELFGTACTLVSFLIKATSCIIAWRMAFCSSICVSPTAGSTYEILQEDGPETDSRAAASDQYRWRLLALASQSRDHRLFTMLSEASRMWSFRDSNCNGEGTQSRSIQAFATSALMSAARVYSRAFISPLCAALDSAASDRDKRGAWLAMRLPSEHLNHYHHNGKTALMMAAVGGHVETLRALLIRGVEVDLTANPMTMANDHLYVPVNALAMASTRFDATCAVDMLPDPLPSALMVVAQELKAETEWQRNTLPVLIQAEVIPLLRSHQVQLLPELISLVCAYVSPINLKGLIQSLPLSSAK